MPKPLEGRVAVIAGATRGAGRGIARMLGEAGATVYCTGRSSRTQPNTTRSHHAGRPETIEETAELVTAAGGRGIAVRVDHSVEREVAALFERVERDERRLDVLANVMTGTPASWKNFLKEPPEQGRAHVDSWVWPHVVTAWYASKLMVKHRSGLIVELIEQEGIGFHGAFYFDLMETLLKRIIFGLATELGQQGISAVAIGPGFMRTEAILEGLGVTEVNWRDALKTPHARSYGWGGSETPCFVGRAVAALAADPHVARKNGGMYTAWSLSDEYGFTDIDGTRPDQAILKDAHEQAMKTFLAPLVEAAGSAVVDWKLVPKKES